MKTLLLLLLFCSCSEPTLYEMYSITDTNLAKSIRWVESRDGEDLYRNEKEILTNQDWVNYYVERYDIDHYGDIIYYSIGDYQILYLTAHWMGYRGEPEGLVNYETNLKYYSKIMAFLDKRYKYTTTKIACYNQGSPRGQGHGTYDCQEYVDLVLEKYTEITNEM